MTTVQRRAPAVTPFFVPGVTPGNGRPEAAHDRLRQAGGQSTGSRPGRRRIFALGCKLGGRNARIEVGLPDPIESRRVLAIFDVGGERPYVVFTDRDESAPAFRLGRDVKTVTHFADAPA